MKHTKLNQPGNELARLVNQCGGCSRDHCSVLPIKTYVFNSSNARFATNTQLFVQCHALNPRLYVASADYSPYCWLKKPLLSCWALCLRHLETEFVIYYWVHPYLGWFIVTLEWLIQIRGGLFLLIPSVDEANIFSTIFEVISVNCHKKTWSFTVLSNRALLCSWKGVVTNHHQDFGLFWTSWYLYVFV